MNTTMPVETGKLRILQVHESYSLGWGGEDTVVELERRLLEERGHAVEQVRTSHGELRHAGPLRQLLEAPGFLWSRSSYRALARKIAEFAPDVVHVHNTFPQLSPSVFWAAHRAGVPVVHTLHNFRHVCANSLLLRDERPCHDCVGRTPWPAVRYGCYAQSRARTAAIAATNFLHAKLGLWRRVDAYIALNEFSREVFRSANFPEARLFVKANFVPLATVAAAPRKNQAVFVGSISRSKGVPLLLGAWSKSALAPAKLLLIGDGLDREALASKYANRADVEWCGSLARAEVLDRIAASTILVFPSLAYENCPMAVLEALSVGTPVVAADHPSLQTIVRHQREGLLFRAGSAASLASALETALHAPAEDWLLWSNAARQAHAERYSEAANYPQLIAIYRAAIEGRAAHAAGGWSASPEILRQPSEPALLIPGPEFRKR